MALNLNVRLNVHLQTIFRFNMILALVALESKHFKYVILLRSRLSCFGGSSSGVFWRAQYRLKVMLVRNILVTCQWVGWTGGARKWKRRNRDIEEENNWEIFETNFEKYWRNI